jgi:hypothetical protein
MPHSGRPLTQPDSSADDGKRTFGSRRQMTGAHALIHLLDPNQCRRR